MSQITRSLEDFFLELTEGGKPVSAAEKHATASHRNFFAELGKREQKHSIPPETEKAGQTESRPDAADEKVAEQEER